MKNSQAVVSDAYAQATCFGTTSLRALESARPDRIINDPFAAPLTRKARSLLSPSDGAPPQRHPELENLIAIRTRYLDEALNARNPTILQVVLLGAGLDARAYRLDSLRDCHVLEVDQGDASFNHKRCVIKELGASPVAAKVDYISANLTEVGWEAKLLASGLDPSQPTFWAMEGLLPYLDRPSNVVLLKTIHSLSAPGSEIWADMAGRVVMESAQLRSCMMKFGEDDPLAGVFSQIPWKSELQASLGNTGTHFGRAWTPMTTTDNKGVVPFFLVTSQKPN